MKKVISILLSVLICLSLFAALPIVSSAEETTATEYVFGKHAVNPLSEAGMQGFTPVMTKTKTTGYDGAELTSIENIINNLATPPKGDVLEEGATRWGLSGAAWESVGQWNYTAVRSDGRIMPYRVAAGVRFDVPTNGLYNISADFFNNSMSTGFIHYIVLKSGDTITTLYSFDTVSVGGTKHDIAKGTRIQEFKKALKSGDELYFLMDSKGEKASDIYPNLEVTITPAEVLPEYVFGNHTINPLSEAGMQGFTPVMTTEWTTGGSSGTLMSANEIVGLLATAPKKDALEENSTRWGLWGQNWQNVGEWNYTTIRSDGRVMPSRTAAGVRFDVPTTGLYNISADFFNGSMPLGFVHYIILKSGNKITTLYQFDTVEVSGTNHEIIKGERKQEIEKALKAGDELYFLMDAKGEKSDKIYPYMQVIITKLACEHTTTEEANVVAATYFKAGSKDMVCVACGETVEADVVIERVTADPVAYTYTYDVKASALTIKAKSSDALAADMFATNGAKLTFTYTMGGNTYVIKDIAVSALDDSVQIVIDGFNKARLGVVDFGLAIAWDGEVAEAYTNGAADFATKTQASVNVKGLVTGDAATNLTALENAIEATEEKEIGATAAVNNNFMNNSIKLNVADGKSEIKFSLNNELRALLKENGGAANRTVTLKLTAGGKEYTKEITALYTHTVVSVSGLSFAQMYSDLSVKLVFDYADDTKDFETDAVTYSCKAIVDDSDNAIAAAFKDLMN